MKNQIIAFFLLSFVLTAAAAASEPSAKRTVIDYYNLTRGEGEPKIVQKNGSWRIETSNDSLALSIVDIPNGYLEFVDSGTGGGSTTITAALFLTRAGEPMLALLEAVSTTGTCPEPIFALKIFHMEMGRMSQIRKVLPELPLNLFLNKGYDPKKNAPNVLPDQSYRIGYRLPRKGTTMEVFLETSSIACGMAMAGSDMPKKEREEREGFLRNVRKEPVSLMWNKDTGLFDLQARR